ncbi:hypothetical protein TR51_15750 [Kitasatospora griseola]|uniref:Uncharacterized protein n=1 Tax=Kitasatospora griseola TaxID=2064 RepID=A0A0D0Q331_KITGR|nr:hypothetical protein TR51_15750 [Kitasatospora griseola]
MLHGRGSPFGGGRPWVSIYTGRCLIDLGEPGPAHREITEGVGLLPVSRDRTRAVSSGHEAENLAQQGEIDHGAAVALRAFGPARRLGATRCIRQITVLSSTFRPHHRTSGVDALLDAVDFAR